MSSPSREGRHTRQMAPQAHPKDFPSPYAAMYYPPPPHPFANAYFSPQVYQPPLWPPHAYPAIPTHTTAPGGSHMSSPPPGGNLDEYFDICHHSQTTREKLEAMGFEVGVSLRAIPEKEWKAAGFKYLEWQNVVAKDWRYREQAKRK
ncbi:hypothetical protein K439DRAFT_1617649 [Ramaria rubella]|nr:hypothetical protein K439DRAFT_1617649 [Ramaria rubella]